MKQNICFLLIVAVLLSWFASACDIKLGNTIDILDKPINEEPSAEMRAAGNNEVTVDRITEAISNSLQIAINDDLWFWDKYSKFDFLDNEYFEYEYYFDEERDIVYILPMSPTIDDIGIYYLMEIPLYDGRFTDTIDIISYNSDYQELTAYLSLEPIGTGSFMLEEVHKPEYDIDEYEMQKTVDNIMNAFDRFMDPQGDYTDIYVRYHYKSSIETIILYTVNGQWCYAYADLEGKRIYKPTVIDDEVLLNYVERLISCSYQVT